VWRHDRQTVADFDEALLDDADALARRDEGRLLWSLATAGAQVRHAAETADEFGVARLESDEAPRAVLVVTDRSSVGAARAITRMVSGAAPALKWGGVELPRWAGSTDAMLVGALDGRHPRIAGLVEQAARRGLAIAVVTQPGSPVAVAAGRAPGGAQPRELNQRAARWAILAPLLQAANALRLYLVPPTIFEEVADALDQSAEACRPSVDAFTNPAKALAVEFAEALPLIAGAGSLAGIAAREFTDALELFAGVAAEAVSLPDGVARAGALLVGAAGGDDDFYADRVAETSRRKPRVVIIGDDGEPDDPTLGPRTGAQIQLDEVAARRAAAALDAIAFQHGVRTSRVDVPLGSPLARLAAATSFGDFTAAYLALGLGIDPSAPRPGELAH
jgi:glucose/mannose-6-phosphate isomerase